MTLRFALCFLFHQNLGEQAALAGRICYRGLLTTLLNHPRMKFNLMLSGTLLDALCWFDPSFFPLVRKGLDRNQFRLLGSTYAQNLLLAGDDWDNARQIALHRRTLKKYFDVEPAAFWSPQRTWAPRLAPLLAGSGYRFLPLEDRTLRRAQAVSPFVYRIPAGENDLAILWEDAGLRSRLDFAAWFRQPGVLRETIAEWKIRADPERLFPVYAEDAGAFGLWGYDSGLDPRADAAGLDELLDDLEQGPEAESAFLEDAPEPIGTLELLSTGWGADLDRALTDAEAPFHEEGYSGWEEFNTRAPRIQHFRRIHGAVRTRLLAAQARVTRIGFGQAESGAAQAAARWLELAEKVFCSQQGEFGRAGIGGRGYPAWEGIGAAIAPARAAELVCATDPLRKNGMIDDFTGDGEDEILLGDGNQAVMLSPYGGRLLYWIDLRAGRLHIGNPLAVPTGSLFLEAKSPEMAPLPDDWLPQDTDPIPERREEFPGDRRLVRLDKEKLPETAFPLPVWPRPRRTGLRPSLPARRRALNDFISLDDGPEELPEPHLDFRLAEGAATFLRFFGYRLQMIKRVRLAAGGLRIMYRFRNTDNHPVRVRLRIVSELCPDYQSLLDSPGRALEEIRFGPRALPGILNRRTECVLVVSASRHASEPALFRPGVLAWELEQEFRFTIEPGRVDTLLLRMDIRPAAQQTQAILPIP